MKFLFCLKVAIEDLSWMKMLNRYAEHMQNFSVSLVVTSSAYGKLTQPLRVSESKDIFLLSPW